MGKRTKRKPRRASNDSAPSATGVEGQLLRLSATQTIAAIVGCIIAAISFAFWFQSDRKAVDVEVRRLVEEAHDELGGIKGTRGILKTPLIDPTILPRLELAQRKIGQALVLDPHNWDAHNELGNYYVRRGNNAMARHEYELAIRYAPTESVPHENLANLFLEMGFVDLGIEEFRRATLLRPRLVSVHAGLAAALLRRYETAPTRQIATLTEAESEIRKVLALDTQKSEYHRTLGNILDVRGDLDGAAKEYQLALQWSTEATEAAYVHYDYGLALFRVGRFSDSTRELLLAVKVLPNFPTALASLGFSLHATGKTDQAIAAAFEALRLNPDEHMAASLLDQLRRSEPERVDDIRTRGADVQGGYRSIALAQ